MNKIAPLTSLRFLFAVWVVCRHFLNAEQFNSPHISNFIQRGWLAVPFFFILSGFVLTLSYYDKIRTKNTNFKNFIFLRFARLYPAYLSALMLLIIIQYLNGENNSNQLVSNLLMVQSFSFSQISLGLSNWSVSVEMFLYLTFIRMLNFFIQIRKKLNIIILIVLSLFSWIFFFDVHRIIINVAQQHSVGHMATFFYYFPISNLPLFVLGILAGKLFLDQKIRINSIVNTISFLVSLLAIIYIASQPNDQLKTLNQYLPLPFILSLIYNAANSKGLLRKILSFMPIVFLGEISYGIYIYQDAIKSVFTYLKTAEYFSQINIKLLEPLHYKDFLWYLAILILSSAISFYFESKIYKYAKNKIKANNFSLKHDSTRFLNS